MVYVSQLYQPVTMRTREESKLALLAREATREPLWISMPAVEVRANAVSAHERKRTAVVLAGESWSK